MFIADSKNVRRAAIFFKILSISLERVVLPYPKIVQRDPSVQTKKQTNILLLYYKDFQIKEEVFYSAYRNDVILAYHWSIK